MDKIAEASLLFVFYGQLLTDKQRQVMELYHEENLSLSEIASEFEISRQAVHDTLKKAEQALNDYEEKLGLVEKFVDTEEVVSKIDNEIDEIIGITDDEKVIGRLEKIKKIILSLEE